MRNRILLMHKRVHRVQLTEAAQVMLRRLIEQHGPVLFHLSGGCCDGSSPMCFPTREFRVGGADVLLGRLPWHTSRLLTDEERAILDAGPPPPTGAERLT
ncbi:DUF779 domain-containing protein [Nocardia sp. NBC_01377]|uniref:DUF779 domain-containing protein n=1 Tax=Nocardia sp. NBC_01377 TaxID=2903595 RepID=UPI00324AD5BA